MYVLLYYGIMVYCIALLSKVLYFSVHYCGLLWCTAGELYCDIQQRTELYSSVLYCTAV